MKKSELASMVMGLKDDKHGRIISATWAKKSGEVVTRPVRFATSKGITGKGMKFNPSERKLVPYYDMYRGGYRMMNLDSLRSIRVDGIEYVADEEN